MTPEKNAHTHDPAISFEAAARITELETLRDDVFWFLDNLGPAAPETIADWLSIDRVSVARRCSDLKRDGWIIVHEELGHTNRSGRRADILKAVRT
jgi:Mn-dependent DtxR family transcriptional regulator